MAFGLAEAIALARSAHEGQVDKAGQPYIEHPLRVMGRVSGEYEQMAAVLHDVVEDTALTVDDLEEAGCPGTVTKAVDALTKRPGESLADSMARVAVDPIALSVKRADIADNSDPARLALLDEATADRLRKKYADSLALLDRANDVNPGD